MVVNIYPAYLIVFVCLVFYVFHLGILLQKILLTLSMVITFNNLNPVNYNSTMHNISLIILIHASFMFICIIKILTYVFIII